MLKISIQLILVVTTIFVINQSCGKSSSGGGGDDNTVIESDKGDGSEGASLEIDGDVLSEDEADISEGSSIANDVTGAYLDLPAGISQASNPINVASDKKLTAEQLAQLTLSIPLKDSAGAAIPPEAYERILVMYHVKLPDESLAVGYIPNGQLAIEGGSASLNLQAAGAIVKFTLRGFGVYQAALLPEGSTPPATEVTKPTAVPIPVTASASTLDLSMSNPELFEANGASIADNKALAQAGAVIEFSSDEEFAKLSNTADFKKDANGIQLKAKSGTADSDCRDSGSAATLWTGFRLHSNRSVDPNSPNAGGATTFPDTDANISTADAKIIAHLNAVAAKNTANATSTNLNKQGSTQLASGGNAKVGNAITFSGSSSSYYDTEISSNTVIPNTSSPFTVMFWARPTTTSNTNYYAFGSGNSPLPNQDFFIRINSSNWQFSHGTNAYSFENGSAVTNTWQHIAATSTGTEVTTYLNGVGKNGGAPAGAIFNTNIFIGNANEGGSSSIDGFVGQLDEFLLFNKALSEAEINHFMRHQARFVKVSFMTFSDAGCTQSVKSVNAVIPTGLSSPTTNTFSNVTGRYYKYSISMGAHSTDQGASLGKLEFLSDFTPNAASVTSKTGVAFTTLTRFGAAPENTTAKFQLSMDDGVTWMYWNGSAWAAATTNAEANTFTEINANIASFGAGGGTLKVKGILAAADSAINAISVGYN
jgi:hypothetical protein